MKKSFCILSINFIYSGITFACFCVHYRKHRDGLKKYKSVSTDKDARMRQLEEDLLKERDANKKNLSLLEEEVGLYISVHLAFG